MDIVPSGAVIGLIGDAGSGVSGLLRSAPADVTKFDYSLDGYDAFQKAAAEAEIEGIRRSGASVMVATHDQELLSRAADEVWWVRDGQVALKGDPREILPAYRRYVAERVRTELQAPPLNTSARRGDGRAELIEIATLDASGSPVGGWQSGDEAVVRIQVRFHAAVADPVVGIMIRTRIGMEVYGTNTELERVSLGPCSAGDLRTVNFRFRCDLCPQPYTLTAASHDPDGVWHDWLEDAIAFRVTDSRYTAGVANLRASVTCSPG